MMRSEKRISPQRIKKLRPHSADGLLFFFKSFLRCGSLLAAKFESLFIRWQPLAVGALILAIFAFDHAEAQVTSNASRRDDYFRLMPFYQHWSQGKGTQFTQFSVPVLVQLRFGRSLNVALRGSQATTSGDNLQKLRGITDTQLAFNYSLANFILNLGFNFPSGKRSLPTMNSSPPRC
jgi:hypothetical protein